MTAFESPSINQSIKSGITLDFSLTSCSTSAVQQCQKMVCLTSGEVTWRNKGGFPLSHCGKEPHKSVEAREPSCEGATGPSGLEQDRKVFRNFWRWSPTFIPTMKMSQYLTILQRHPHQESEARRHRCRQKEMTCFRNCFLSMIFGNLMLYPIGLLLRLWKDFFNKKLIQRRCQVQRYWPVQAYSWHAEDGQHRKQVQQMRLGSQKTSFSRK